MAQTNSRYLAIETLVRLTTSKNPLPVVFQKICTQHKPGASDRSLAMNLIYGVLRQQQYLEAIMAKLCRQPLKKLHPHVRQGLSVGLFQIFFLTRIPHSAAVNETVKAIKITKAPKRLHGFVNGVLRESIRQQQTLSQPDNLLTGSSPILNHPQWLTDRWQRHFGREDMLAICRYNNSQQPLVLRINSLKITRTDYLSLLHDKQIDASACIFADEGVALPQYQGQVTSLPGYDAGLFQVQGEAAQLASRLLCPVTATGRYLDGCAGLGGKTSHLLQMLTPHGASLTAVEPEKHRLLKLKDNLKDKFNLERFQLFAGSLDEFAATGPEKFHGILIDAPCSGTGVTGKQPDIRWRRTQADITRYAEIQQQLMHQAVSLLHPGGVLVYATCSLEPEENLDRVNRLLELEPELKLTDPAHCLPASAVKLIRDGCFQPRPSDGLDGFFAARLVRSTGND